MSRMKKAQVTAFIIVGILILAITGAVIWGMNAARNSNSNTAEITEAAAVQSFVQQCADESAKKAIIFNGFEGGYFSNFDLAFYPSPNENDLIVPSYFLNESVFMPSISTVQKAIEDRFDEQLLYCTDNFTEFKGIEVEDADPQTEVTILNDKVMFSVNYPVKIKKQNSVVELDKVNTEIHAELMTMLNVAGEYMEKQKALPDSFLVSLAGELASRNGLEYRSTYTDEGIILTFIKKDSALGEPYEFWFGLKYGKEEG